MADRCRVLLFDRDGRNPYELDATIGQLMWGLGDQIETTITVPIYNDEGNPSLYWSRTRFANQVYIQHQYLPDWGGVIWTPLEWNENSLILHAQSAEIYLAGRLVQKNQSGKRDIGGIVLDILQDMEQQEDTPIVVDSSRIHPGKEVNSDDILRGDNIYNTLNELAERYGYEWYLEPQINKGKPEYIFHWNKRRVAFRTPIEIGENGNADWIDGSARVVETSRLTTAYMEIKRSSGGAKPETNIVVVDDELLPKYGRWEQAVAVEDTSTGGTLSPEVQAAIREDRPRQSYHFAVHLGVTGLSKQIRPGTIHQFYAPDAGFRGTEIGVDTIVRVSQMAYSENSGYLEVVADEISESELGMFR